MSLAYTKAKAQLLQKLIDFAADDIRAMLVMTNSTCINAGQEDASFIASITTLDEMDGAGYVRKVLAGKAVTQNNASDRGEFNATSVTWTALGAGTRSIKGVLIYKMVTNDADSIPIVFIDTGGFPIAANGGDLTIAWNAAGILQTT